MGCVSTGFAWCSQSRLTFKVWQIVPRTVTHLIQDLVGLLTLGNATEYAVGLQECIHSHNVTCLRHPCQSQQKAGVLIHTSCSREIVGIKE